MSSSPQSLTELVEGATRTETVLEFIADNKRFVTTTGEVAERALRVASGLRDLGVRAGDRITVQMSNRPEAVVLQLAALHVGAILTPVVPVFGPRELELVLDDAKPQLLVTERRWNKFDYLAQLREVDASLVPEHIVVVDGGEGTHIDWAQLEEAEPITQHSAVDEKAPCLVIYTSGSTGVPKGVQHSRATLWAEVLDFDYRPHADSDRDVYLQGSAAGHIGGYMFTMRALYYNMRTLVIDGWDAATACRLVSEDRVTAMVATPFHVVQMLDLAEEYGIDLSSLDMMMAGGAPVSADLVRRADELGVGLVRAYGMSEHPTFAIGLWSDPLVVRAEHDGYITGANEVRLVDDDGVPVEAGSSGEIQVRGPEQFLGYTNAPDGFTEDGWFATGDIGIIEGRLVTVVDRKKNVIIRGGENLSATEIENVVATHPSVSEVAVIGVPDDRYGERACAFVVLAPGTGLDLDALRQHFVSSGVAKQKTPEFLEIVEQLPRTGTGKIRKHELVLMRAAG